MTARVGPHSDWAQHIEGQGTIDPAAAGLKDLLGQGDNQLSTLAAAAPLAVLERSGTSASA